MTARRAKKDTRWKLMKFAFFLYVFMFVFALIWIRTTVVQLNYELSGLETQRRSLLREEKTVLAEKANFYSVGHIEKVAIQRLGMSLPERENIYFVKQITAGAAPYKVSIKPVSRDN
ncbi:MAG TPA: hypothetical protein ENG93_00080 [Nitrospirae bacterium]|nr:hypothetical protein [Nitrospirota bacterium]